MLLRQSRPSKILVNALMNINTLRNALCLGFYIASRKKTKPNQKSLTLNKCFFPLALLIY